MTDAPLIRAVGAVIRDADGRLLLVQRGHEPAKGQWTVPGGHVEPGESDAEALRREVREETGLDVEVGPVAGTLRRERFHITDHVCRVVGGSLRAGSDAADVRWVQRSDLAELPTTDGLEALLDGWGVL